jgi:hypothetical protein
MPAANPFDQFDAPAQGGNPFDQFDAQPQAAADPRASELPSLEPITPSPEPSMFRGAKRYFERLGQANDRAVQAGNYGLGGMEALASVVTGGLVAPILGTAESVAFGTPPEESFARATYQPRSEAGQAQLGYLGALVSPLTESGADIALGPLFAGESQAARVPANAARPAIRQRPVPGPSGQVVEAGAPAQEVQGSAATSRPAGLASVPANAGEVAPQVVGPPTPAFARYQQLQSLPVKVPATRGQLTRDPVQLRNEGNVSATETGKPIRDIYLAQNEAILNNLDVLKGRVANKTKPAETPEQVGISVQDQALRAKLELKKKEVSAKYKAAEAAGELQGKVSPARIIKTIRSSPDVTHYGWVESWLSKAKVIEKTDAGTVTRKLTLKEMEDLRQAAVARAMDGGTEGYYAGKVISAIDDATEGAGGNLYKEARAARRAQATEFEETGAVARLVENKSRTDRATALEDTWRKTVIGGSIEDVRNVKRSLLTGGDAKTRTAGRRAWRDIKAQTIQHIKDEATKSVATNERGQPNVTPAAMKRAIDSIGKDKLDEVFGTGTALRIERILEATRTVKTVPPPGHAGSSTMSNVLAFLERGLGRIPVVGSTASGAVHYGVKLHQAGASRRIVKEAQRLPRNTFADQASKRNALADY